MPRKLKSKIKPANRRAKPCVNPSVPELKQHVLRGREQWVVLVPDGERVSTQVLGDVDHMSLEVASALAKGRLAAGSKSPLSPQMSFDAFAQVCLRDFALRWKPATLKTFTGALRCHLVPAFGTLNISQIHQQHLRDWQDRFKGKLTARDRITSCLSSIFKHAEERGVRPSGSNPAEGLRKHRSKSAGIFLSEDEYAALGRSMRRHSADHPTEIAALRFIALTGCRVSEALSIQSSAIETRRVVLPDSKSGEKVIWLSPEAKACFRSGPSGAAFDVGGKALGLSRLSMVWLKLRDDLTKRRGARPMLRGLRIHDLRHSFAGVAISENTTLPVLSGLLGHRDRSSAEVYAHIRPKTVNDASQRVGDHLQTLLPDHQAPSILGDKSLYAAFIRSRDTLVPFCRKHRIEPAVFQKGLLEWRSTLKRNQEVQP